MAGFPDLRMRRLRSSQNMRRLVRETRLSTDSLVYPIFVIEGNQIKNEIPSMPGIYRFSPDMLESEIETITRLNIPAVLLFGIPRHKDETGSAAWDDNGVVQQAIKTIKGLAPDLLVITDVCLCEYTSHGHCGVIRDGQVSNDDTLPLLDLMALSHAAAGADMIAPSDMMDGRVASIRQVLDNNGFSHIPVMAYSAKYASAFYGPFREAAGSAPAFGDRRSYQMPPTNSREALREIQQDIDEGADIVMVKPALAYLDIIRLAHDRYDYPIAAYNVSGEYAMVKAAAAAGYVDGQKLCLEILDCIKRAGADIIITYHAKEIAARLYHEGQTL